MWARQVLHVVRKDLLLTRWYVAASVGVIAVLTRVAIERGAEFDGMWNTLVLLTAVTGICLAVQNDSPHEPQTFWTTRPLNATAVAAAKVLEVILTVLVVRAVTHIVAGVLAGETGSSLPGVLAGRNWLLPGAVAGAAVIAALTTDVRSFLVVSLVSFAVVAYGVSLVSVHVAGAQAPGRLLDLYYAYIAVGSVPVLLTTYHKRERSIGLLGAAILAVASLALATVAGARWQG